VLQRQRVPCPLWHTARQLSARGAARIYARASVARADSDTRTHEV
jgi:hypothetical protein